MSTKEQFRSVVDDYYNGMYRGDPELIRKAFHPEARLQGIMEGQAFYGPRVFTAHDYFDELQRETEWEF